MYELLIVDDESNTRDVLATCFPWHKIGFHVCGQSDNGRNALNFLKDHVVHVILTDISMPVMDGIELSRHIFNSLTNKPIIIFLSAYTDFEYARNAIQYGVRYYVLKPTNFSELEEVFTTVRGELDLKYRLNTQVLLSTHDEIIEKVKKYCLEHYRDGSLAKLSKMLYLNPSYLSQLIKQRTGLAFSDLMTAIRMEQAALLLKEPDVKIFNISSMVGYVNPNNFTRAFKSYFGMTPTEYKNNEIKKQNSQKDQ